MRTLSKKCKDCSGQFHPEGLAGPDSCYPCKKINEGLRRHHQNFTKLHTASDLADARRAGIIEGLNQARGIVKYHLTSKPCLVPAAKAILEEADVFLRANINRGGRDGTSELMASIPATANKEGGRG